MCLFFSTVMYTQCAHKYERNSDNNTGTRSNTLSVQYLFKSTWNYTLTWLIKHSEFGKYVVVFGQARNNGKKTVKTKRIEARYEPNQRYNKLTCTHPIIIIRVINQSFTCYRIRRIESLFNCIGIEKKIYYVCHIATELPKYGKMFKIWCWCFDVFSPLYSNPFLFVSSF